MSANNMGMTAVEKVLARTSGKSEVKPGDVVYPAPDFIMIHDGVVMGAKRELDALGIDRLAAPDVSERYSPLVGEGVFLVDLGAGRHGVVIDFQV